MSGKLSGCLMAYCVGNIRTKNYQNLLLGFQVTVENVGDVFSETQCKLYLHSLLARGLGNEDEHRSYRSQSCEIALLTVGDLIFLKYYLCYSLYYYIILSGYACAGGH